MSRKAILCSVLALGTACSAAFLPVYTAQAEEQQSHSDQTKPRMHTMPSPNPRKIGNPPHDGSATGGHASAGHDEHGGKTKPHEPGNPGSGTTHAGGGEHHGKGGGSQPGKGKHDRDEVVINEYNRTVIDEGFGPYWPVGPAVALENAALISAFGWQPTEAVVETVPLADFGECHYHVVTDKVSGQEKVGVWISGKEVMSGSEHAMEQVLTNCTTVETPAATFADDVTGFYPDLVGETVVTTGTGVVVPEIIQQNGVEQLTYFVRAKNNDLSKVVAKWGAKQPVEVTTVRV